MYVPLLCLFVSALVITSPTELWHGHPRCNQLNRAQVGGSRLALLKSKLLPESCPDTDVVQSVFIQDVSVCGRIDVTIYVFGTTNGNNLANHGMTRTT